MAQWCNEQQRTRPMGQSTVSTPRVHALATHFNTTPAQVNIKKLRRRHDTILQYLKLHTIEQ